MEDRIVVAFTKIKEDEWRKFHAFVAGRGEKITTVLWRLAQEYMEKGGREE